jgi:hypothetical protein
VLRWPRPTTAFRTGLGASFQRRVLVPTAGRSRLSGDERRAPVGEVQITGDDRRRRDRRRRFRGNAEYVRRVNLIERQRDQSGSAAVSSARPRQRPDLTCSSVLLLSRRPAQSHRQRAGCPRRPPVKARLGLRTALAPAAGSTGCSLGDRTRQGRCVFPLGSPVRRRCSHGRGLPARPPGLRRGPS